LSIDTEQGWRAVSSRVSLRQQVADIARYREFLLLSVRTQLKVKYKNSALGFLWSMLNPALYLVVFYVVFQVILENGIPNFAIFLLSGLLVWNLFSFAIAGATGSITASAGIVKKVAFPREILPLASVGAGLIHFFLQSVVLVVALVVFRHAIGWEYLPLLPLALGVLLVFAAALGLFLAAINVSMRDTQHLVELAMLAWFWMTPIVYPFMLLASRGGVFATLYELNPMVWIVLPFQRALYNEPSPVSTTDPSVTIAVLPPDAGVWWYCWHLLAVGAVAAVLAVLALRFFARAQGTFSEDL
jgi:ABC-2 type transport system permease protein